MTAQQRAMAAVNAALTLGQLRRGPCEECGRVDGRIEGHHDDYSQVLSVRWLCRRHHALLHAALRRAHLAERRRVA